MMLYTSTQICIEDVVRKVGTLEVPQIYRFFRNAPDQYNLNFYLNERILCNIFDYDEGKNQVTYRNNPALEPITVANRIRAFWIIAEFGYENIREIEVLRYPSQFLFITEDNDCFDITFCADERDGVMAGTHRSLHSVTSEGRIIDETNHIALVRYKSVGDAVLKLEYVAGVKNGEREMAKVFDQYCILDDNKTPQYFGREDNHV